MRDACLHFFMYLSRITHQHIEYYRKGSVELPGCRVSYYYYFTHIYINISSFLHCNFIFSDNYVCLVKSLMRKVSIFHFPFKKYINSLEFVPLKVVAMFAMFWKTIVNVQSIYIFSVKTLYYFIRYEQRICNVATLPITTSECTMTHALIL